MAYNRRNRSTKKRRVFNKKERAAIERIAEGEIETLHYSSSNAWAGWLAGYVGPADSHQFRANILSGIPRITNTVTPPTGQEGFRGNEIEMRGVKINLNLFQVGASAGNLWDVQFRLTLYEMNDYLSGVTNVVSPLNWEVPQYGTNVIGWYNWNTQAVKIHRQIRFTMDNNGNRNALVRKKWWFPWVRKCVPEGTDTSTSGIEYFGSRMGTQLYLSLEVSAPGANENLSTLLQGNLEFKVYFKDA